MSSSVKQKNTYWRKVRVVSFVLSILCLVLVCSVGFVGPWSLPLVGLGAVLLGFLACLFVFAVMMDKFECER
jgi:hypothetical protein